jgi:uncharacterized membrane protein YdfJ with MMPL/SSD domain
MQRTTRPKDNLQAGPGLRRNRPGEHSLVRRLSAWCIAHRGRVLVSWLAVAVLTTVVAGAVGRNYATNFTLPGTESQRALDLLKREFPTQSGDVDTVVFHVSHGTVDSPQVRRKMTTLLGRVSHDPHVVGVLSPYGPRGGSRSPAIIGPRSPRSTTTSRPTSCRMRRASRCWIR